MEPQNTNQGNYPEQPNAPNSQVPNDPANSMPPIQTPVSSPSVTPYTPENVQAAPQMPSNAKPRLTEKAEKLKKLSIFVMVGGLIGAAVVAVVAVLAGSFNDTFAKALFTLLLVMVHALACLAFIEQTGKSKSSSFKFFENTVFFIIVLSFFTSIFGVWSLLTGNVVAKLYGTYMVLLFACLHGQMLVEVRGKKNSIDTIVYVNFVVMSLVIVLLLPLVWDTAANFPSLYFRLLAACGIVDGTLTILAVILHRLHLQKHPELQSAIFSAATEFDSNGQPIPAKAVQQKRRIHPLVWLLGIFIVGQIVTSLVVAFLGAIHK